MNYNVSLYKMYHTHIGISSVHCMSRINKTSQHKIEQKVIWYKKKKEKKNVQRIHEFGSMDVQCTCTNVCHVLNSDKLKKFNFSNVQMLNCQFISKSVIVMYTKFKKINMVMEAYLIWRELRNVIGLLFLDTFVISWS